MSTTTLTISDMHCGACEAKIRQVLKPMKEIADLQFNTVRRQLLVSHGDDLQIPDLLLKLEKIGFSPELGHQSTSKVSDEHQLKRLGIAGLGMMQVMMIHIALYAGVFQGMDDSVRRLLELTALLFCLPVVTYSAVPFFIRGLGIRKSGLNMDTPIALAIGVAFMTSFVHTLQGAGEVYYDSVVMFTFLMLASRYIDSRVRAGLEMDASLETMLPSRVARKIGDVYQEIPLADVLVDDEIWVSEGEVIPVDGTIRDGVATIDESWLSGESDWQTRRPGEVVHAGTVNQGAGFSVCVRQSHTDTRMARISRLADVDFATKHAGARLADKVAKVFVPSIIFLAMCTYVGWSMVDTSRALPSMLAVLIVSCPCALSLAIPTALTATLTRLRQAGIYLPKARTLELVNQIGNVFFDKTGTLTSPDPSILQTEVLGEWNQEQCLSYAASLQLHSAHVLARAFRGENLLPTTKVQIVQSAGVEGCVDGHACRVGSAEFCGVEVDGQESDKVVWLNIDNQTAAKFTISHELRTDAQMTVAALQAMDVQAHVLSGDKAEHCAKVAQQLGVDFQASQSPESKSNQLKQTDQQQAVMFVGDGINDLPALAAADISVATLETVDLVRSKADVILLTQRLSSLVTLFKLGRQCHRVIQQNMSWALGYNVILIPLAAFGFIPPWVAALGMSISSLIVMLNASRLLKFPTRYEQ